MPLYFRSTRNRRVKTLREEMLSSQINKLDLSEKENNETDVEDVEESEEDLRSVFSLKTTVTNKTKDSFLGSSPRSLTGSFLRNKLDNPLFKTLFPKKVNNSALNKVQNASDIDPDEETEDEPSKEDDLGTEVDERIELETIKTLKSTSQRRWRLFNNGFLLGRSRIRRLSLSSHRSINSSSDSSSETDVEILTKLEDSGKPSYLLFTHKGQQVRLQFFFDYLLISPVISMFSRIKTQPRIVYYEDLALWTNNDECLKLVHITDKNTAKQHRSQIKLFVNKKKVTVTPRELNAELKARVSILMAGRMNIDISEARKLLEKNCTDDEVDRVVQKIDREAKKCVAKGYRQDYSSSPAPTECLDLMNI